MGNEIFIPLAGIFMIIAIVVGPAWLKSRERREMQATLRASIERGQALPPEVIEALSRDNVKSPPTASRDLRLGVILLSVAIGIAGSFVWVGEMVDEDIVPFAAWGFIPGAIGLAFILLSFFNKNKG